MKYKKKDPILKDYQRLLSDFGIHLSIEQWEELSKLSHIAAENKIRTMIMEHLDNLSRK